jgi:hypothetical protein
MPDIKTKSLDEAAIRQIVAEEVGKALAPIAEALKSLAVLDEIKTTVTKAVATRSKGPRGIVVAREVKVEPKNETPAASPYKPLY